MADAGIGETMLLGAAMGGGASALTGKDPLRGALMGGATSGLMGGFGSLFGSTPTPATLAPDTSTPWWESNPNVYDLTPPASSYLPSGIPMGTGDTLAHLVRAQDTIGFNPDRPYANIYDPNAGTLPMPQAQPTMGSMANIGTPYQGQGALTGDNVGMAPNYVPPIPAAPTAAGPDASAPIPTTPSSLDQFGNWANKQGNSALDWMGKNPLKTAGLGLGAYTLYNMLSGKGNNYLAPYQPPSAASYGLGRTLASNYMPTRPFASGGIASLSPNPNVMSSGSADINFMGNDMYPQSQMHRSYYATPTQAPLSAQQAMAGYEPATNPLTGEPVANMAEGGSTNDQYPTDAETIAAFNAAYPTPTYPQQQSNPYTQSIHDLMVKMGLLQDQAPGTISRQSQEAAIGKTHYATGGIASLGSYSDGGQMLKGPGDGMSDNIPASIGDRQPARLADGEFVVPADVVSHLGNGSTDAGAKQLYSMLDKVRKARTGNPKQGKQINPQKFMPA